jgi:ribosome-associated protein
MTAELSATLAPFLDALLGRKPLNVVVLDVRELTSIADAFIICSGRSSRQVSAIAEHVERELRDRKIKPMSVEGGKEGQWVLMDYAQVLIHIFQESAREFYDLEGLWADARRVAVERPAARRRRAPAAAARPRAPGREPEALDGRDA